MMSNLHSKDFSDENFHAHNSKNPISFEGWIWNVLHPGSIFINRCMNDKRVGQVKLGEVPMPASAVAFDCRSVVRCTSTLPTWIQVSNLNHTMKPKIG